MVHYVNPQRPSEVVQPRLLFIAFVRSGLTSGFAMKEYGVPQKAEVPSLGMATVPPLMLAGDINGVNISAPFWIS